MLQAQNNRVVRNQAAAGDAIQTPIDYPRPSFQFQNAIYAK
jgi:hypothetical protein